MGSTHVALRRRVVRPCLTAVVFAGLGALLATYASAASPVSAEAPAESAPLARGLESARGVETFANSRLAFVAASRGEVRFAAHGPNYAVYFRPRQVVVARTNDGRIGVAVAMRFLGTNPDARLSADRPLGTKVSYLLGRASNWHTGLPTFGRVVYRDLWPGIDARFTGGAGTLKYEFVVHPGADVRAIRLAYNGAGRPRLSRSGDLLLPTRIGVLRDQRPIAYQPLRDGRASVNVRYDLASDSVGFVVGRYTANRPLVIDPAIAYSTYLGGSSSDEGLAITVDANGSAYVSGRSDSFNFPTTPGAFAVSNAGGGDVFVAKLSPSGSSLVYSTFIGGSGLDEGRGVAVDAAGNAYLTGFTYSANFPTTGLDRTYGGNGDGFVAKLSPTGSSLLYSTYIGGAANDRSLALALDSSGVSYVTGETKSSDYPATLGSFDPTWNGDFDVFVTAVNASGTTLVYSTFLGSPGFDDGLAITVDAGRSAHVTGKASAGFPVTPGAFDVTQNGGYDSFVAKLDSTGSRLLYNTYLGGNAWDEGLGIAVDSSGNTYSTGNVQSSNFPTTSGAFDRTLSGSVDAYATKLNATGSALVYSSYLGGTNWDEGDGLVIDSSGNAYIGGHVGSTDFPTTADAFQRTGQGSVDPIFAIVNATGTGLIYSTYIGSPEWDGGFAIAADSAGAAYLTGFTMSSRFPTTSGAFDRTLGGATDVFVTKIDVRSPSPPPPSPSFTLSASPAAQEVVRGNAVRYDVTITPQNGFTGAVALSVSGLPQGATASFSPNPATSSSVLTVQTSTSTPPGLATLTITGTSGGMSRTTTVQLNVHCCPRRT